jgi:hypothetical protein
VSRNVRSLFVVTLLMLYSTVHTPSPQLVQLFLLAKKAPSFLSIRSKTNLPRNLFRTTSKVFLYRLTQSLLRNNSGEFKEVATKGFDAKRALLKPSFVYFQTGFHRDPPLPRPVLLGRLF